MQVGMSSSRSGVEENPTAMLQVNEELQKISNDSGTIQIDPICEPIGPPPAYEYNGTCPSNTTAIGELPGVRSGVAHILCV